MKNLMNIDSSKLISSNLQNAKVGDIVHAKAQRITGFGRTMEVVKVTPKRIKCKLLKLWFPTFGIVAKGKSKEMVRWLKSVEESHKGMTLEFLKSGEGWGNNLQIVEVFD